MKINLRLPLTTIPMFPLKGRKAGRKTDGFGYEKAEGGRKGEVENYKRARRDSGRGVTQLL